MRVHSRTIAVVSTAIAAAFMLLPAAVSVASTATASASDDDPTVVWGVRPADNAEGTDRPNYSYVLAPGSTIEDAFVVTNHDEEPLTLQLYAADGFVSATGQLDVRGREDEASDVGAWVQLAVDEVTIEPGVGVEVPFTLSIPPNATPGDHTGGIISSMSPPGDTTISVERRLGSRVHVRVEGELRPALAIQGMSVSHTGSTDLVPRGEATVRFTVANTGNARISGSVALTVHGPFGLFKRVVEVPDLPELLPGSRFDVEALVSEMPATGVIFANATVTPTVVDPDGVVTTTAPQPVRATAWGWALPWLALAVVAVVLAWLVRHVVRRRRRRRATRRAGVGSIDTSHVAGQGATVDVTATAPSAVPNSQSESGPAGTSENMR